MDQHKEAALQQIIASVQSVHGILETILIRVSDNKVDKAANCSFPESNDGLEALALETHHTCELAKEVEFKLSAFMETQRKEKNRSESKLSSLMKDNMDVSSMLKVAITEKEAAEKSLGRSHCDGEQRKSAILQIAEKGLQKVGFGFIMGFIGAEAESAKPDSSAAAETSDGGHCEEEVISLASIVEKTMKNQQHEISDLRKALEESRSDCDHLQLLAAEQVQKITDYESHIKDLEERENLLVEELTKEIADVEQEVTRWREACELEVEAGKIATKELNQKVTLLTEELGQTKTDLEAANNKLQLKEKLVATAMAAQAAAEACLQLADSRSTGLQHMIEELTRQIEEEDRHGRQKRKAARRRTRHVCWPWQRFQVASAFPRTRTWCVDQNGRLLPEMEALLHLRI